MRLGSWTARAQLPSFHVIGSCRLSRPIDEERAADASVGPSPSNSGSRLMTSGVRAVFLTERRGYVTTNLLEEAG
jgi:hypothetical protein